MMKTGDVILRHDIAPDSMADASAILTRAASAPRRDHNGGNTDREQKEMTLKQERAALVRALASVIFGATQTGSSISRDEFMQEHVMVDGFNSVGGASGWEKMWEKARDEIRDHLVEFDAND